MIKILVAIIMITGIGSVVSLFLDWMYPKRKQTILDKLCVIICSASLTIFILGMLLGILHV